MKKILIFRSSNLTVLDKLIKEINIGFKGEVEIHIILQQEVYEKLKKKYGDFKYYIIENGFFNYNNYIENKKMFDNISKNLYDYIYIPLSTNKIDSCSEIELITSTIKKKNTYIYTNDGKYIKRNTSLYYLKFKKCFNKILEYLTNLAMLIMLEIVMKICMNISKIRRKRK